MRPRPNAPHIVLGAGVLLLLAGTASAQRPVPGTCRPDGRADRRSSAEWTLIWQDEFDGAELDPSKWRAEDLHLIKNNELQYYTPDDVYLEDGMLVLRSQERSWWGYDENGAWRRFDYTSGLAESRNRFSTMYGRIEVRAQLPSTQGIWPAHWMLPASGHWPPEIDIMELLGHEPTRVYMTHHWGTWPNVFSDGGSFSGPDFSQGYHTFAIEWTPDRIDWYVDDVLRFTSISSIPQEPFYIILNTAVGGNWPGNPDDTTVFPQHHRIDYVRVYAPGEADPVLDVVDGTPRGAHADGRIEPGEYVASLNGINDGLFDLIGEASTFHLDSSVSGGLHFAFESATAWPMPGVYGAVIYLDAVSGGATSTIALDDDADRPRRMASGVGIVGQQSDLVFAPGFAADYAICLEPEQVTVLALSESGHSVVNGAALGADEDFLGGKAVRYRIDDGSAGFRVREFAGRLEQFGLEPGASFKLVVTLLNGDSTFRANEFVGVAPGNWFDDVNVGYERTALKSGDFIRFTIPRARDARHRLERRP